MATPDEKYELITRRLQETLGGDIIKAILAEGRQPKCYWGASNTIIVCLGSINICVQELHLPEDVCRIQLTNNVFVI